MKQLRSPITLALVIGAVLTAPCPEARAQSSDAIIDKLVEKGILTVDEATELRQEADQGFDEAFKVKTGLPETVKGLDFTGDFRGRYEGFYKDSDNFTDRHRWRYRLRVGVTLDLTDNFEFGFQVGSGDLSGVTSGGIDPISQNQTIADNASKKGIFIDLAYATWHALRGPDWTASTTIGKMNNPFMVSDLVFDKDYTPEGLSQTLGYRLSDAHSVNLALGAFVLDEIGSSSRDPYLFGGQTRLGSQWTEELNSSIGFGVFSVINRDQLANNSVPNVNVGNDRAPGSGLGTNATPLYAFNILEADASLTYVLEHGVPLYRTKFPITLGGDFLHNLSAAERNNGFSAGVQFGKSGKKGLWDISYRYKYLEGNAWYEEFLDSDSGAYYPNSDPNWGPTQSGSGYRTGTNVKGHVVKLQYSPFDVLTLAVTGFFTEAVNPRAGVDNSSITRVQADASLKF
jgi:hypothetical protein